MVDCFAKSLKKEGPWVSQLFLKLYLVY